MLCWKDERGAALVIVFLALFVVFFTATALVQVAATEMRISKNQLDDMKALYIADAGIAKFLARLDGEQNPDDWPAGWESDFTNVPIGDGYLESIEVKDLGTSLKVTGVGVIKRPDGSVAAQKSVYVIILKSPYANALVSGQGTAVGNTLKIRGNSTITGNLVYNGDIDIESSNVTVEGDIVTGANLFNSGTVNGNVLVGGSIANGREISAPDDGFVQAGGDIDNSGTISVGTSGVVHTDGNLINSGTITADYYYGGSLQGNTPSGERLTGREETLVYVPEVPPLDFQWYEDNADMVYASSHTFSGADLKDIPYGFDGEGNIIPYYIYVKGDVVLKKLDIGTGAAYSGVGIIIAEGDVSIDCDIVPDDPSVSALGIINPAGKEVEVKGSNQITGVIVSEGTFETSGPGNATVEGSVVAAVIDVNGKLNINYNADLVDLLGLGLPGNEPEVKVWKETYPIF